jgi:hypothetical protein
MEHYEFIFGECRKCSVSQSWVARFILVQHTKRAKIYQMTTNSTEVSYVNTPNGSEMNQMALKLQKFSFKGSPKYNLIEIFGTKIYLATLFITGFEPGSQW